MFVCNFVHSSEQSAFPVSPTAICNELLMAHMEEGPTAESLVTRLWAGWPPIPIWEEAAWAPQLVWVQQWRWEKSPPLLGIDPWLYGHWSHSLVTILSHPVLLVTYFNEVFIQDHVYLSESVCFREWLPSFEYELLSRNRDASTGYLKLKFKSRSVRMSNWLSWLRFLMTDAIVLD